MHSKSPGSLGILTCTVSNFKFSKGPLFFTLDVLPLGRPRAEVAFFFGGRPPLFCSFHFTHKTHESPTHSGHSDTGTIFVVGNRHEGSAETQRSTNFQQLLHSFSGCLDGSSCRVSTPKTDKIWNSNPLTQRWDRPSSLLDPQILHRISSSARWRRQLSI